MNRRKKLTKHIVNNKRLRRSILRFLEKVENGQPKTVIYVDLFNTGFVIDSKMLRDSIIKHIKSII